MSTERSFLIRRAEQSDTAALALLLLDESYPIDLKVMGDAEKSVGEQFTYLIGDTKPFGFVSAGRSGLGESSLGQIAALYLAQEYRYQGIGRKLLVRGLSVLKLRNFDSAHIWADAEIACPFASLGFEPDGSRRAVNGKNIFHQIGYRLSLGAYF